MNSLGGVLGPRSAPTLAAPACTPAIKAHALGPSLQVAVELPDLPVERLWPPGPDIKCRVSQMADGQIPDEEAGCCGLCSLGEVRRGEKVTMPPGNRSEATRQVCGQSCDVWTTGREPS